MKRPSTLNHLISTQKSFKTLSFLLVFFLILITTKVHSQIPDTILSSTDTNYFQITSKIDAYLNSLPSTGSGSMGSGSSISGSSPIEEDGWEANYYRWKSYWESRIDIDGNFESYYQAKNSAIHNYTICNIYNKPIWKEIGPLNDLNPNTKQNLGRISAISVNPSNYNDIIVAGENTSFWRTIDGGVNWKNTADDEHLSYVGVLNNQIFRQTNFPSRIFAAAGSNKPGPEVINKEGQICSGIIASLDNGETWEVLPCFNENNEQSTTNIEEILIYSTSDQTDLSLVSTLSNENQAPKMLFTNLFGVFCYAFNINDRTKCYKKQLISTWDIPRKEGGNIFVKDNKYNDLYISPIATQQNKVFFTVTDQYDADKERTKLISFDYDGNSSSNITDIDLDIELHISGKTDDDISGIGLDFNHNGDIYLLIKFKDGFDYAVYRKLTTDANFVFMSFNDFNTTSISTIGNISTFNISPYNDNVWYVECFQYHNAPDLFENRIIMKSIDYGVTFTPSYQGPYLAATMNYNMHVDLRCLSLYSYNKVINADPNGNEDNLLLGTDGGINKSINGASTFQNINGYGLDIGMYYGAGVTEQDAKHIEAGAQDGSYDLLNNNKWYTIYGGDKGNFIINPLNINESLHSQNAEITGNWSFSGTITYNISGFLQLPLELDRTFQNRFYFGDKLVKTHTFISGAEEIININTDVDRVTSVRSATIIGDLQPTIYYSESYFGGTLGGVYKAERTLTGNWINTDITSNLRGIPSLNFPLGSAQINDIAVSNTNKSILWVVFGNLSYGKKVYKSSNGGLNWVNISGCLPNIPVFCIVYQNGSNNRIYIGTDIGVYYHDDDMDAPDKWVKYGNNQLDVAVYDLDINYCGNYLLAATYGRGIRQAPLLPIDDLVISSDVEWNNVHKNIYSNIHITKDPITLAPTTLKITNGSIINMAAGKKITIDPGCKLLVDNSTITNECNTMWEGIVVRGDKMTPQELTSTDNTTNLSPTEGYVYLNNATISYAREAIRLWNPEQEWVSANQIDNHGESGGIVIAENSTFINNRRSVEFMWYKNYDWITGIETPNMSSFKECTFKVTDDYRTDYPFYAHVSMWDNRGINYKACTFANNKTNSSIYENKGMGIISMDANFTVENIGALKSQFKGLTYGVNVINSEKGATNVNIIKSAFNKNQVGAYLLHANQSIFKGNSIALGRITNDPSEPDLIIYGTGFNQSGQFTYEDNYFTGYTIAGTSAYTVGEWFMNNSISSDAENVSNNNKFNKIPWASHSNYFNRKLAIDGTVKGLQFKCNKNIDNIHDFTSWSSSDPIYIEAGIRDNQGNLTSYAGNTFSVGSSAAFAHFNHIEPKHINYYISVLGAADAPDPTKVDGNTSLIQNLSTTPVCPIKIFTPPSLPIEPQGDILYTGMGWIQTDDKNKLSATDRTNAEIAFINHKNAYLSYSNQLKALIDAGNTDVLLTQINSSTTSTSITSLRADLLGASPYLSQTVLEATVNNTSLPPAVLFEILGANPDAGTNEKIINKLIELNMPQYMIDYIQNNIGTINAKKLIESAISEEHEEMMKFHRMIIQDILNDPIAINHTEYRGWLGQLNTIEADYEIVDDYIATGQYTNATDFMNDILNNYSLKQTELNDYNDLLSFNNWKIEALNSTGSLQHLDNSRLEELQSFANNGGRISKDRAQSILNYFYDGTFQTEPEFPTQNNQRRANPFVANTKTKENSYIKVYPNPAKDIVFFEYLIPCIEEEAILEIRDITGNILIRTTIEKDKREYSFNTEKYSSGNYIYKVICGGNILGKGQFSILK